MGHSFHGVPHVIKPLASRLEAEASAKLCLERNAERLGEAGRAEEVDRLTEIRLPRSVLKLSAEVRSVEDIESLEEETDFVSLVPLKELRDAQVAIRKRSGRSAFGQVIVRDNARIDDRDANARARVTSREPRSGRTHSDRGPIVVIADRTVEVEPEHFRPRFKLLDQPVRQIEDLAVDDVEIPVD